MTHRSRNGGPPKTHRKPKQRGTERRRLHHPPQPPTTGSAAGAAAGAEAAPRSDHPLSLSPTDGEILALLRAALKCTIDSDEFIPAVQKIKGLLYDKKWLEVFEDPELLEAYAGRWVPSRVMCFRELFVSLAPVRAALVGQAKQSQDTAGEADTDEDGNESSDGSDSEDSTESHIGQSQSSSQEAAPATDAIETKLAGLDVAGGPSSGGAASSSSRTPILSLGGGAGSEMLAFASILHGSDTIDRKGKGKAIAPMTWTGADIGAWDGVLSTFGAALASEWSVREERFQHAYIRTNLLESLIAAGSTTGSSSAVAEAVSDARITTLLFTLTELFTQSRVMAVRFLRALTARTRPGGLLLVADSASDISEFEIGTSGRKWPVYFILDTVLLGPAAAAAPRPSKTDSGAESDNDDDDDDDEDEEDGDDDDDAEERTSFEAKKVGTDWELLDESDSRWFRLAPTVAANWPVKLENTRYWFRLYRRS